MPECCICKEDVPTTATIPCTNGGHSAGWCDDCAWSVTQTNTITALNNRPVEMGRDGYALFPLQLPCPICRGAVTYMATIGSKGVDIRVGLARCLGYTLGLYSGGLACLVTFALPLLMICIITASMVTDSSHPVTEFSRHSAVYIIVITAEFIGAIGSSIDIHNGARAEAIASLFGSVISALIIFIVARRGRGLVETVVSVAITQFLLRVLSFYRRATRTIPQEVVLVAVDYSQVTPPPQMLPANPPS